MKKDLNLYNKNGHHVPRKNKRLIYRNNIVKLLREKIKPSIGSQAEQIVNYQKEPKNKKRASLRGLWATLYAKLCGEKTSEAWEEKFVSQEFHAQISHSLFMCEVKRKTLSDIEGFIKYKTHNFFLKLRKL